MLLAIDVGNTNLLFGVYRNDALLETWRVSTDRDRTADEHALLFRAAAICPHQADPRYVIVGRRWRAWGWKRAQAPVSAEHGGKWRDEARKAGNAFWRTAA